MYQRAKKFIGDAFIRLADRRNLPIDDPVCQVLKRNLNPPHEPHLGAVIPGAPRAKDVVLWAGGADLVAQQIMHVNAAGRATETLYAGGWESMLADRQAMRVARLRPFMPLRSRH
jgi:hypothetical protein